MIAFESFEKFGSNLEKDRGKQGPLDLRVEPERNSSVSSFGRRSPGRIGPMLASPMSFVEKSVTSRRFWRVTMRAPEMGDGFPRARNLMKTVSKESRRSNVYKRLVVSSGIVAFVCRVSEVTEGNVCGPENDETSSMNSVLRDGKEPPRKVEGMSNVCSPSRE